MIPPWFHHPTSPAQSFCASMGRAINSTRTYVLYPCSQCLPRRPDPARRIRTSFNSFRCSRRMTRVSRWFTIRSVKADCFVFVRRWLKWKHSRPASGHTRFPRSRHRSGQTCKRRLTWLLPTTLIPMSWVRRLLKTLLLPLDTLITIVLIGGYEFLMENCTSIGNCYVPERLD
jgi:hypothetical protein